MKNGKVWKSHLYSDLAISSRITYHLQGFDVYCVYTSPRISHYYRKPTNYLFTTHITKQQFDKFIKT